MSRPAIRSLAVLGCVAFSLLAFAGYFALNSRETANRSLNDQGPQDVNNDLNEPSVFVPEHSIATQLSESGPNPPPMFEKGRPNELQADSPTIYLYPPTDPSESEKRDTDSWRATHQRDSSDLATMFLLSPHSVHESKLVRHVLLNLNDMILPKSEIESLGKLITQHKATIQPLMSKFHASRQREMVEIIDAGKVLPAELPKPPPEDVLKYALRLAKDVAPPERDLLIAKTLQHPPSELILHMSHIKHKGKVYLLGQFEDLPDSDKQLAETQEQSLQFLVTVFQFFLQKGLTNEPSFTYTMSRAFAIMDNQQLGTTEPLLRAGTAGR